MEPGKVSKKLLMRLPHYLNYLRALPECFEQVSATAIANALGLGEVQVRKDLAKVSSAGRSRTGRSRTQLIQDIEGYLACTTETGAIVVGAGNLDQNFLELGGFSAAGLNVMAGFDIQPENTEAVSGRPIYAMSRLESFCKYYNVSIGIIAVPAEKAQTICDSLIACGIRAIWNFTPVNLMVPDYVKLQRKDPGISGRDRRTAPSRDRTPIQQPPVLLLFIQTAV